MQILVSSRTLSPYLQKDVDSAELSNISNFYFSVMFILYSDFIEKLIHFVYKTDPGCLRP